MGKTTLNQAPQGEKETMKKKLRNRIGLKKGVGVTGALLGATLTGAALTGATHTSADNTTRRMRASAFPFVTLPRTQGVRLNATYVAPPDPDVAPPDPSRPGPTCQVRSGLLMPTDELWLSSHQLCHRAKRLNSVLPLLQSPVCPQALEECARSYRFHKDHARRQ
jgi:hypothetical protein